MVHQTYDREEQDFPETPNEINLTEMAEEANFQAMLEKYPRQAAAYHYSGLSRRSFMKIMGASLALTGVGLTGCVAEAPDEQIIPYARQPEEVIPGIPIYFASAMTLGGYTTGLLIETEEGRPTRIEGNPNHPASLGSSNVFIQASILHLYDPDRSITARKDGTGSDWATFLAELADVLEDAGDGAGLRILTETVTSPTLAAQMETLLENYPAAQWVQYEPVAQDNVLAGSRLAFDADVNTVYNFAEADVVLALDADFMSNLPGSLRYARDFMDKRRVREDNTTMSRLYAIESTPTITGAAADERLAMKASDVEAFARALAAALGVDAGSAPQFAPWPEAWLDAVVADLQESSGNSIVIAGPEQTPIVHALAHAINAALGNVGSTVTYTDSVVVNPSISTEALATLTEEMANGDVDALIMIGGNPAFTAPADIAFADALANVGFSMHLSLYFDETSQLSTWHIPITHFIEEWSDGRSFDGTASIVQPPIGPLWDTVHSPHELLAAINGTEGTPFEILQANWESNYEGDDFELFWRTALHDGVVADSAFEAISPSLSGDLANALDEAGFGQSSGLEIVFRPDPGIFDGRFANNAWLQELPAPLTKVTWDMAAVLNPATAEELGLVNEEVVELTLDGRTIRAPIFTQIGMALDTVAVTLGYGGDVTAHEGEPSDRNVYAMRTTSNMWHGVSVDLENTGDTYTLAASRWVEDMPETDAARSGTLRTFVDDPDFAQIETSGGANLIPPIIYDGYAWGMSIDLTSCIGCNACMIACQMENNIPTVGKEAVEDGRDMSWIRIDTYYITEGENIETRFQPVACVHCEMAPCELVCPVEATIHDHEGINNMVYNRCIGTRYCSANCPYSVRRFNFESYTNELPIMEEYRNPNVSVRVEGVMEKCTYCTQRINMARIAANAENRLITDGEITPACAGACPTQAIIFGNINDEEARVTLLKEQPHDYGLLEELNTIPRTTYLARVTNPNDALHGSSEEG